MAEIGRLDDDGKIIAVDQCHPDDHKTCPIARTVALPVDHDMRGRLHAYHWDFARGCFLPLSAEPLDAAERDTPDLVEGLVQAIEHLQAHLQVELPDRSKRALQTYRRRNPRTRHPADNISETAASATAVSETAASATAVSETVVNEMAVSEMAVSETVVSETVVSEPQDSERP